MLTDNTVNRRDFLTTAAAATTAACLSGCNLSGTNEKDKPTAPIQDPHNAARSTLDRYTAHGVSATFLTTLTAAIVANEGHLTLPHASVVLSTELARLAALTLNGKDDRVKALGEIGHLFKDMLPALVMIAAADIAERSIALNPAIMAGRINNGTETVASEDIKLSNERPNLVSGTISDWNLHLNNIKKRLSARVARTVAITSTTAPFASTLTASAFWKDGLDETAHLCTELAFSQVTIDFIKNGREPASSLTEISALAATKATQMINSSWGYNQLGIALACNGQGLFALGSPPNFWFAMNHIANDPVGWAKSEAKGAIFSESQTLIATAIWLARCTGESIIKSAHLLLKSQIEAVDMLKKSLTDSELRATTFGDGSKLAAKILPIIRKLENSHSPDQLIDDLKKIISDQKPAYFQVSLSEWLDRMQAVWSRILRKLPSPHNTLSDIPDPTAEELSNPSKLQNSAFIRSLKTAISSGNKSDIRAHLELYQQWKQSLVSQKIAVTLHKIANSRPDDEDLAALLERISLSTEFSFDTDTLEAEDSASLKRQLKILTRATSQLTSTEDDRARLKAASLVLSEGGHVDEVIRQLGFIHRGTFETACELLQKVGAPLEDLFKSLKIELVNSGSEETSSDEARSDTVTPKSFPARLKNWLQDSWKDPRNMSEATRDIIRLMATQLPAIPAVTISLTEIFMRSIHKNEGEKISPQQLKSILKYIPTSGYAIASTADNIPGYLILENVVTGLFKNTFSLESLDKIPHFATRIGFICKAIASQSGMVFPFSSATNLLQDQIQIVPTEDPNFPLGFGIVRERLTATDTTSSWYMRLAAASTIGWSTIELLNMASEAEKIENKSSI